MSHALASSDFRARAESDIAVPESTASGILRAARRFRPVFIFLLLAAPALWLGYLVYNFGVDVPFGDQWDGVWPLFQKMQAGTLGLSDFYAFHSEHRIFFPRLIIFALARLTDWNVRAELLVIWLLACVCAFNLWRLTICTGLANSRARLWLLFAANVFLFTPQQWENFLFGFQIAFMLPLAAMTALPWVSYSLRRPLNYLATLALCLVCTFSIASGFTAWLLTAPLLAFAGRSSNSRAERKWQLLWDAVAIASTALYFHGYKRPAIHPSPLEAVHHPLAAFEFLLAYLGNAFAPATRSDVSNLAKIAGATLLIPLVASLFYLLCARKDRELIRRALPWLSVIAIAFLSALLTMLGRMGFGITGALQSRYISFAIMLPIGLIFLVAIVWKHWRERSPLRALKIGLCLIPFVAVLAAFFTCATLASLSQFRSYQHHRLSGKSLIFLNKFVFDPQGIAQDVHRPWPLFLDRVEGLDRLGYLRPRPLRSAHLANFVFASGDEKMGEFERYGKNPAGDMAASGWAILPERGRVADSVILTYENQSGDPIVFARADVCLAREDLAKRGQGSSYRRCGWRIKWQYDSIPADATRIGFWAFDAENGRAYSIGSVAR